MEKELWWTIGLYHFLPSIIRVFLLLIIVYFFIKIFKLENPAIKSLLYCIPLIKGYIGLLLGTGYLYQNYQGGFFHLSTFFEKNNILNLISNAKNNFFYWAIFVGVIIIFIINIARWIGIAIFYYYLSFEAEVKRTEAPLLFEILDELVPKFETKYPKVILCHKKYMTPFMIGVIKPKLVFSPNLIGELNRKDLSIIIAHELAHLRRHDYFLHWLSFTLRDCQFFNPLAQLIYKKIEKEKEKAADLLAVKILGIKPIDVAKTLTKVNAFLSLKEASSLPLGVTSLSGANLNRMKKYTNISLFERIVFLTKNKKFKLPGIELKLFLIFFALLLLVFNFTFAIPVGHNVLVVR